MNFKTVLFCCVTIVLMGIVVSPVSASIAITGVGPITGSTQVGGVLTAGALAPSGATATYQWVESSSIGGPYTPITGGDSLNLILGAGDASKYIEFEATGTGSYTGTVTSAAVGPVTPLVAASPVVTSISPSSGPTTGGTTVTIYGSGFSNGAGASNVNYVMFGGIQATSNTFISDTEITATSPAQVVGTVNIVVTTPVGASASSTNNQFTYIATASTPTVTGISPIIGPSTGGTTVTIYGSGFSNGAGSSNVNYVKFGGIQATSNTFISDTEITATSPAASAGTVNIVVTTPVGSSSSSTNDQFTYTGGTSNPLVSGISPSNGPINGGTSVTIYGSGFSNGNGASNVNYVMFGSTQTTSFRFISDSEIIAISPGGSGTVNIAVTTPIGTSSSSSGSQFTYIGSSSTPTIYSISPTSGPLTGGTSVAIYGSGFSNGNGASNVNYVMFGSTQATSVSFISDSEITAISPPESAGTVNVAVTTPYGTTTSSSSSQFTFAAVILTAPATTFIASPSSGPAPLTVQFTDTSTNSPTSWNWNFGDGSSSSSQNPSHTYQGAGTYTVSLTTGNNGGSSNNAFSQSITVFAQSTITPVMTTQVYPSSTQSGLNAVPVIGAFAICGVIFLARKNRN
jgi:hypothetical protein